jgi:hypothetical protein
VKKINLRSILANFDKIGLFEDTLSFLDVGYSHHPNISSTFSSGEYAILGLFSRIYDKKNELTSDNIILLDEAEVSLHPKWQREFVQVLLNFLEKNFGNKEFQVVLTSHSPVILSDTPKWAVIFLKSGIQSSKDYVLPETFGANIHELYSSAFALDGNLIGEFATRKIQNLVKELFAKKSITDSELARYSKLINIIGEPFIKQKLTEQIAMLMPKEKSLELIIKEKEQELEKLKASRKKTK